jgi:Mg2+ and Co2+ transporter CorA
MSAIWDDIVKDWESVPLETYKFLFSQAKDKYDEIISESISITEKSINLTKVIVVSMTGFVGYNFKTHPGLEWIIVLSFLFLIDFILLVILMFPKSVIFKGSSPDEIFCEYLDNPSYSQDEKTFIVYYHEIRRYQERINVMIMRNNQRQYFYGTSLILTILCTVLTVGVILSTIF